MFRTHTLGEIDEKIAGKKATLSGWVDTIREHGSLIFIDLRDRYGKVQCVISKKNSDFAEAKKITTESCIQIIGEVKKRPKGTENKDLKSGMVEISIEKLNILSLSEQLPFDIHDSTVSEDLRLKYRYLDLRSEKMKYNIQKRYEAVKFIRDYLDKEGFLEITTPILTKSSPEGARDFIVPSRIHPGKFYALPQSPQQYKQMLMVGGIDKYFQIAPCFRDEDARADRSPGEFYQLDLEMSFVEQEDILNLTERLFTEMIKKLFPEKKILQTPFPRLTYEEAMKKYGRDNPDLRKNPDDKNELAFCWVVDFPLFKEQKEEDFFHGAGERWGPSHHMFTMPKKEHLKYLNEKDAGKAKSLQHDLILNGYEVGGGSIRIHLADIQEKIFDLIGFTKKEKEYFSHMLTAFKYGVPPHGGIAPGIDRLIMVILGEPNLRELIAFPKNKEARDVLFDAPSEIEEKQLKEAHIKLDLPEKAKAKKTVKKSVKKKTVKGKK
ncbi:aspartate--tRNA ligase [Candidatus Pacearchaeota archaeon CG10_big_fil_rev_8_21_14_0_10_34_12]|nr:MAG: aspartate--tRNA ligase [Candidatus Pacearchaeota archaeon CG10_big_fil_rev_8_21_14_0_10_34_12]